MGSLELILDPTGSVIINRIARNGVKRFKAALPSPPLFSGITHSTCVLIVYENEEEGGWTHFCLRFPAVIYAQNFHASMTAAVNAPSTSHL